MLTFSACCAVAAIDPTPRNALQCERHEGVFTMTVPFFTRIHALPEVAQYLYPGGRPRSPEESAAWLQATLESDDQRALALSRGPPQGRRSADRALRLDGLMANADRPRGRRLGGGWALPAVSC